MAPLLRAPRAACALSRPRCPPGGAAAGCSVDVANAGAAPCLYVQLSLRDPSRPAGEPQFHAASFSHNYVTIAGGGAVSVEFRRVAFRDRPTVPLVLCLDATPPFRLSPDDTKGVELILRYDRPLWGVVIV
eukprot:gene4712-6322_t